MNTLDRIEILLRENNIPYKKMLRDIGLSDTVYWQWRLGSQTPSVTALQKIADYFDVSMDYLRGCSVQPEPMPFDLPRRIYSDRFMLDLFGQIRNFDDAQKEQLLLMVKFLRFQADEKIKKDD